ncbi:MAG: c-type cytochrome [Myxococcota bacterium]|jgi:cytochrome c553
MTTLRTTVVSVSLSLALAAPALAGAPEGKKAAEQERTAALGLTGDAKRGKEAYKVCAACHLDSGAGRADGTFPQLAGQHASVIIKQVADIRAGVRANPVMHPFSTTLVDPQELADVAAYIQTLPVPGDNQKGSGTELALGQKVYEKHCASCHGKKGEGDAKKFVPELAGQHFAYVLKQSQEIRDGKRGNSHTDMMKTVKKLGDKELTAVADYLSRLATPAPEGAPAKQ